MREAVTEMESVGRGMEPCAHGPKRISSSSTEGEIHQILINGIRERLGASVLRPRGRQSLKEGLMAIEEI